MEIKFNIELKTIKKAFAMMDLDIPSDEEINQKLSGVVVNISNSDDEDTRQAEMAFTLMAISKAYEDN